jgi:hypothetical protein
MREKEIEEVLEEALSACIEEGRSLDEVLREHVAYRGRLEPLLIAALDTYDALQAERPKPAAMEEGLARFLADARVRRDIRFLKADRNN